MIELPNQLPTDIATLQAMVRSLHSHGVHMEWEIGRLESLLRLARGERFGSSSEKLLHPGMRSLFPEQAAATDESHRDDTTVEVKSHTRTPTPRKSYSEHLPREDVQLDIPEADRRCDCCGGNQALKLVSEQISEKLHVVPAQFMVRRYHRPVYSCPTCETMKAATMPPHPIAKCGVTTETLAGIAVGKYMDGLPLYRQEQIFAREGIEIGRDKMSRWMVQLGERLQPLVGLLHRELMVGGELCMDETSIQVLKEEGRSPTSQSFMLVQARGDPVCGRSIVLFHYSPSRSRESIGRLLEGFSGILLTDGLGVYDGFGGPQSGVIHAACWAHVRRKFVEAQKGTKATSRKGSLAEHGLRLINMMFQIEAEAMENLPTERLSIRQASTRPLVDELKCWLDQRVDQVPKKSLIGEAIRYTLGQWPKLVRFLDDGRIAMHNNFVENMIRPFAVGRKAWLFADTPEGAMANATLYSLLVTAKVNGLHPTEYLVRALTGVGTAQTEADLRQLLPLRPIQ